MRVVSALCAVLQLPQHHEDLPGLRDATSEIINMQTCYPDDITKSVRYRQQNESVEQEVLTK